MSRLIKKYPYLEKFKDTMEAFAESVHLLNVLGLEFKTVKEGTIYLMRAQPAFKAYEDKQGIFISFVNFTVKKDSWISEKKIITEEYYCDEIEICDAVYKAIAEGRSVPEDETLIAIRDSAAIKIIPPAIKKEGYSIWYD